MITLYVLLQTHYPGALPWQLVDETAQVAVRGIILLGGILVAILWAKVNPYTPIPPISLRLDR